MPKSLFELEVFGSYRNAAETDGETAGETLAIQSL